MYVDDAIVSRGMALMAEGYSWARVVSTLGLTPGLTMYTLKERWDKMVLSNYVRLEPGIPKRLHLVSHAFQDREITDPITKQAKTIRTLVFQVDWEDSTLVSKQFSITSDGLAQQLSPFLPDQSYKNFNLSLTKTGAGFQTDWQIRWEKR